MAISVVGTPQAGNALDGLDVTLMFSAAPAQGDIIIVVGGHFNRAGSNVGPASGYTSIITHTDALPFTYLGYRVANGSETTVVGRGSGNAADASAYACIILRGVDPTVIFDQTTTEAGPTASTNPDAPAIVTQTANALVIAMAVSTSNDGAPGTVTNYTVQCSSGGNDTNDASVSIATRTIASPTNENPPAWSAWTTGTWRGFTIALKAYVAPTFTGAFGIGKAALMGAGS